MMKTSDGRRRCGRNALLRGVLCLCWSGLALTPGYLRAQHNSIEDQYAKLVQQGKEAEAASDWDRALGDFQEALKLKPKSATPQIQVAEVYLNRKDFEAAMDHSERALALEPQNPDAAKVAGLSAYALNKPDLAVQYFQKAVAVRSKDAALHYWLGMALYALRDARRSLDEFYRARLYGGDNTEVLYMIGKIHWEMCQQAWDTMVRLDPKSVRVKQVIAERDEQSNLFPEAIEKYQEIIKQQPNAPGYHDVLGKLYVHIGKLAEAEQAFRDELKLDSHSFTAYYGLADIAFRRQEFPAALENVRRAIAEKPDFGEAYGLLGRIEWHQGEKEEAVETLQHAASLRPADASLYYMLAHYYEALGKRELAEKTIKTYKELKREQEKENEAARQ